MKVLVTGGAGFIGSHLVRRLLEKGHEVHIIDNLSTGKKENIKEVVKDITFFQGDLVDEELLKKSLREIEVVFHLAAVPSVPRSINNPIECNRSAVDGTLLLLWHAKEIGIRRVVFAASSSAYGDTPILPKKEDMAPLPLSPYGVAKLAGEMYGKVFSKLYPIEFVGLRYFNVFGPRQDPASEYSAVIPKFITQMLQGKQPTIYGDGSQTRDFTYIDNVVEANFLAAEAKEANGEVMNIACADPISLLQLTEYINKILNTQLDPLFLPHRDGDIKDSYADIEKAKRLLNFNPLINVKDGLKRCADWYRNR